MNVGPRIAVIVEWRSDAPGGPASATPLGWLARGAAREGIELLFCNAAALRPGPNGGGMTAAGVVVRRNRWQAAGPLPVSAGYCRYAPFWELDGLAQVAQAFQRRGLPFANPVPLVRLCRDKLQWFRILGRAGGPCPETVATPNGIVRALREWGRGFLKPRFGALGRGVWQLRLDGAEVTGESAGGRIILSWDGFAGWIDALDQGEPYVLQREVILPATPCRGFSIRSLIQRGPGQKWRTALPVARLNPGSVVGNVARGAVARPLASLRRETDGVDGPAVSSQVEAADRSIAAVIDAALGPWAPLAVEVGLDYALSADGELWCLEGNDTPRGRLAAVAAGSPALTRQFRAALRRPVRHLAGSAAAAAAASLSGAEPWGAEPGRWRD